MTAEPIGRTGWAPDTVKQKQAGCTVELVAASDTELVLTAPFEIRLPSADIAP